MQFCISPLLKSKIDFRFTFSFGEGFGDVQCKRRGINRFASPCWSQSYNHTSSLPVLGGSVALRQRRPTRAIDRSL